MSKQANKKRCNAKQSVDWAIDADIMSKYKRRFNFLDKERRRCLSGKQAYYSFMEWGLPLKHLAKIWKLADIDEDKRLVSQEYILAMQLCKQMKVNGNIPDSLPISLIPPLFRDGDKNNILFHCDEQVDMGIDQEYNVYLLSQEQTTFVTHKLCIICFKLIERSNFSRHWKGICKQQPIVVTAHQPCPYCPLKHQHKLYRSDNLNTHLLNEHQIGKIEKRTGNNTPLKKQKNSRNVSSTLRISTGANKSWSSTIVTTNEESLKPSTSSDIPEFSNEVVVDCMERDSNNQSRLNDKVNLLEKENNDLRSKLETLNQQHKIEKEELNFKVAGLEKEIENMRKETLNQKLLIKEKNLQSIQQLRCKLTDKIEFITKNGQEITTELIQILLSDDSAAVLLKFKKLLKMDNPFINDDVKFWCHKELSELYALHVAEVSKQEDPFEQFRHVVAALRIKFDESMMLNFKKIKSLYGNDPLDRIRPSKNYIKYCYAVLNLEETATMDEIEDAVIELQVKNHPDDEKARIKRPKIDYEDKKCDNLFTDLELSNMQTALLAKIQI